MKKLISLLILSSVLLFVFGCGEKETQTVNKNLQILDRMEDGLKQTVEENGMKVIEIKSVYGKLNGNGNGINFFAAALVERNAAETPDGLISALLSKFEIAEIQAQTGQKIESKYIVNSKLEYETALEEGKEYSTVFVYNSSDPDADLTDPLGH